MQKLEQLYEGKAKKVFRTDDPELYIVDYKDDATAFNGLKKGTIAGKGVINNQMTNHLMRRIEKAGIPTHFVQELSERETLVKKVSIVPLEVIIRNLSAGSFAKRYGVEEGIVFDAPTIEFSYKNDELGDPLLNSYHALALKLATAEEIETIKKYAFAVNDILKAFWAECGVTLVDFKLEFGRLTDGTIVLADEISPDTCRLWDEKTHEKLDKDRFRRDLGGVDAPETTDVAPLAYYALYALQHRGQESAGIAVNDDGVFTAYRDVGLVNEVFPAERLRSLGTGTIAVGHVRYGTTGSDNKRNVQPILVNHYKGRMALAHNGNLTNSHALRQELESQGSIFQTTTDSEVIAYIIVQERLRAPSIEEAVSAAMDRIEGAYSLVISSPTKLIAVRDPHGFRPLCMGRLRDGGVVFASESCALDAIGARFERDILPGEIVVADKSGVKSDTRHCGKAPKRLCVFEFIYFARPDSVIDGSSVHVARQRAGAFLALEHPVQADIVIGVPDSGLDAALGYARQSGIPYGMGFIKNKYIGRTFISPTQAMRENEVNIKLNPIRSVVEGKRVVLIDDSIVRGTTCRRTIDLLRKAGAKEIHMRVSAPPFVAACYYGTDIDDPSKLIANNHSVEEIAKIIGVDSLGYLSLQDVVKLADNTQCGFCTACFGGGYPTAVPQDGGKDRFECKISERERT